MRSFSEYGDILIRSDHDAGHAAGHRAGLNGYIGGIDTDTGAVGHDIPGIAGTGSGTGDQCWCNASVFIRDTVPLYHHSLWVILDVYGDLFFAPSFNTTGDAWPGPWIPGETLIPVLEPF
ncbi:MAG TPA: hypothetical protein PLV45_12940, partial [bacterium]|nr:hypothetical protein [bacterium]